MGFCEKQDARHISAVLGPEAGAAAGIVLHDFYVPAGGDVPDRALNPKFAHKLDFLAELRAWGGKRVAGPAILVGDLNVAPLEHDVWSHKQLLDVVSHTPVETEALETAARRGRLDRCGAASHPGAGEDLHLVELPLAGLVGGQQGPAPRPCLGLAGAGRHGPRGGGPARRPRLGAALRPRPGDPDPGAVTARHGTAVTTAHCRITNLRCEPARCARS